MHLEIADGVDVTLDVSNLSLLEDALMHVSPTLGQRDRHVRTTWKMPSTARMLARKALPRPSPFEAPRTRPAISKRREVSSSSTPAALLPREGAYQ